MLLKGRSWSDCGLRGRRGEGVDVARGRVAVTAGMVKERGREGNEGRSLCGRRDGEREKEGGSGVSVPRGQDREKDVHPRRSAAGGPRLRG